MKRFVCLALISVMLFTLCFSAAFCEESGVKVITLQQWLDSKGEEQGLLLVCVAEVINPVLVLVTDDTASVNLFGIMETEYGTINLIETAGIQPGDVLLLKNARYNEFEGTVEIADAVPVRKLSVLRQYIESLLAGQE